MLLEVEGVTAGYGAAPVIHDVTLGVGCGEIVTLLGANGAGKTTTLRAVSQALGGWSGEMRFEGRSIAGMSADKLVASGISHVPEGRRIFPGLSVVDNLRMGAVPLGLRRGRMAEEVERILTLFPRLHDLRDRQGWGLSGGEAQMLAVGRGLMAAPKLLLLDEPSLGLAPMIIRQVLQVVRDVARQGMAVLIVEQNVNLALQIAARAYVLDAGRIVLADGAAAMMGNDRIKQAYLGGHPADESAPSRSR